MRLVLLPYPIFVAPSHQPFDANDKFQQTNDESREIGRLELNTTELKNEQSNTKADLRQPFSQDPVDMNQGSQFVSTAGAAPPSNFTTQFLIH